MSCQCVTYFPGTQPIAGPDSTSMLVNLMAYWKMEEGGGVTHQDAHTGNYDLASNGAAAAVPGIISQGTPMDGSPGNQLSTSSAVFGITGAMTIAGWIKFTSFVPSGSAGYYLVGKQDLALAAPGVSTAGYMIYIKDPGVFTFWHGDGLSTAEISWTSAVDYNAWYFIVAGYTGSNQFIQVNNLERLQQAGVTPTAGPLDFEFSGLKGQLGPNALVGLQDAIVDEWGVWFNRVLTESEVAYLYNSGSGRTYPFT